MNDYYFLRKTFLGTALLLCLSLTMTAQQATSIRTGASFQWQELTQPTPNDSATLKSITINGLIYRELVVPTGYQMTQVGPTPAGNRIQRNGNLVISNSTSAGWNDSALSAFQDFNLNHYFESNVNGVDMCGDSATADTTTIAQRQSLLYDPAILSTPAAIVCVTERNANNCYYVEVFGTLPTGGPVQKLGATFVRNGPTLFGQTFAPPSNNVDYWLSGRVVENNGTIGLALFYLNDIAPLNSKISRVQLTASTADHGDGKFFISSLRSDLGIQKTINNPTPLVGENIFFTMTATNGGATLSDTDAVCNVLDQLPSGYTFISASSSTGSYDSVSGDWSIGELGPGQIETLTIVARINPSGDYRNIATISGANFDYNLSNNQDTATAYPIFPNPDINVTFVNVPVTGDLKTNDNGYPTGTAYGTPTVVTGNPGPEIPTINSNGTYTFTSAVPGVFKYLVPVCGPTVVSPNCPITLLTITVLDTLNRNNPPVANTDIATTKINTSVTLNTLENDGVGNPTDSLDPSSVTILDSPSNGTVTVDLITGNTTYTPDSNFVGIDTLTYQVCDNSTPPQCASAIQIISVLPEDAPNTTLAADDYNSTQMNMSVPGNVSSNDTDPEGNSQSTVAQNTSITGIGVLILGTDGSYTFTPATGYVGPANFPYQTCDNGTPQACADATLYITVNGPIFVVLPIKLVSFTGTYDNGMNRLHWTTQTELNNQKFEIYHGAEQNKLSRIATISTKATDGNSDLALDYSFDHMNPLKGTNYYRLSSVDIDGQEYNYSTLNIFVSEDEALLTVYPNPVKDDLHIAFSNSAFEVIKIQLSDITGAVVYSKVVAPTSSNFEEVISIKDLASGIYLLNVKDENGYQYSQKINKR